ncbi:hypothetical protein [Streptomyces canus]|uniref:hypothetical protein n=1 Tax=Streptomyces canus TaxID=58343 RepID=UPI00278805FF|nr:hypothetical protein [Streptomyces canus]MDQ0758774.1 hypothetical protein [Streptomyces canus]
MPRTRKDGTQPDPPEGYVFSDEAARRMSITRRTLWNRRQTGKGPQGQRRDGRLIYSIAEIDAFNKAELESGLAAEAERAHNSRPPEPRLTSRRKPTRTVSPEGAEPARVAA